MAPKKGAAKSKKTSPKKASAETRRDKEWVPSQMGEAELNRLVEAGVVLDCVTAGSHPTLGEPFPMPHTNEVVVFEDYFWRGLGFPVHPFLRDLLELWVVSLCNLHPNTILHISIFIDFCEAYLRILPHFNLFRHLFHINSVWFLRPAPLVLQDMVDVAADCRVALFHVEPLGIPPFQRSVQRYVNILAGHCILELQIDSADHPGATTAFLLQPKEMSEEVEVQQNPKKHLTEMDED